MSPARFFARVATALARQPWAVLAVVGALVAVSAWAATGMGTQPVEDAFFDRESPAYQETQRTAAEFGGDPIVVLAKGPLDEILSTDNLQRLQLLEACLGGDITRGEGEFARTCRRLAALDPVMVMAGPASFIGGAAEGIRDVFVQGLKQLESAPTAPDAVVERQEQLRLGIQVISHYGLTSMPGLDNQDFVNRVVYGSGDRRGGPKPRLNYLFPSEDAAQIVLRLRPDLTPAEESEAIALVKAATEDDSVALKKASYLVSGSPVVFDGLADALQIEVVILALVALVLMAVVLGLIFGSAWRLLPLGTAVAGIVLAAGALRLAGGSFSLAAVGAAPILAGLAVDYAVQIQARLDETDAEADPVEAIRDTARLGLPMIALACLATAVGFSSLLLSDLPLVSEFGVMLGAGIVICFLTTFVAGIAALALRGRRRDPQSPLAAIGLTGRLRQGAKSLVGAAVLAPTRVLIAGLLIAGCGWLVSTQAVSGTEIGQLLPTRAAAVQDLLDVEESTGTSGNVDVVVRAEDVTAPAVVAWIGEIREQILRRGGYIADPPAERFSCRRAELCPGPALVDFVIPGEKGQTATANRQVLRGLPEAERESMIVGGLRKGKAAAATNVPFSIRSGSVDRQSAMIAMIDEVIDDSRGGKGTPAGVTASVTGLPVVVAESLDALASARYLFVLVALIAVAAVLAAAYRSFRRALVPLVPIVVAGGWSALIVGALGLPLNPLSAVLSVLVIAIATEFSVILTARFRQEREAGSGPVEALRASYGRTGMAVLTSGVTAIAGFATLAASDIGMLREFGLIATVDLAVALAGVVIVLPAVLMLVEARDEAAREG